MPRLRSTRSAGAGPLRRLPWFVVGAGALLFVVARVAAIAQNSPARPSSLETQVWDFGDSPAGPMRAIALLPRRRAAGERFPLLIALHGRGEAERGVERGAWGWSRDYELGSSDWALRRGRLSHDAFFNLVDEGRLAALRSSLARQPYRGLVVVTPYTPDVLGDPGGVQQQAFDAFVVNTLVPRARASLPVVATREATGIDGVSLGGFHALWTGLGHPEVFGAVGALQAAVRERQQLVADRFQPSADRPAQRIRLVTSDRDVLKPDVEALSQLFTERGIQHELRTVVGPHDYVFNRGPGGVEMLLFHDRALRGEASP